MQASSTPFITLRMLPASIMLHVVMGGFHLSGPFFEPIIDRTAKELQKLNPAYIVPTHCTGRKAIMEIEKKDARAVYLEYGGNETDVYIRRR